MNVVHIITVNTGGAYTAVRRIAQCMESDDVHSVVLLRNSVNSNVDECDNETVFLDSVFRLLRSKIGNLINLLFSSRGIDNDMFASNISSEDCIKNAQVIFVHWINSFLSYKELDRIKRLTNKPVVIVMHDMWHATGGCHYSINCEQYTQGCRSCPRRGFASGRIMQTCISRKSLFFRTYKPYIVTISEWEKKIALTSAICNENGINDNRIFRIWNPINTDIFKPYDRMEIRKRFHIDEKPVILFGADRLQDEVKGVKYIFEALALLDVEKYNIICFGINELPDEIKRRYGYIRCLGRIDDEQRISEIYSMSDVYVTTAVQEAFGYTCCEALSCGTPVVAFAIGGMIDQIVHKQTGYLATPFATEDVSEGIIYCISNSKTMREAARKSIIGRFDYETISKQYQGLIQRVTES